MEKNTKIILGGVLVLLVGVGIYYATMKDKVVALPDGAKGCYVANLAQDVYTLNIQSQIGDNVTGKLVFKNFEKDSSSGDFTGTYKDGILLGRYTFQSEGMNSDMQVIFKKQGNDFVRGYGEMDATGEDFVDLNKIDFDSSVVFKVSGEGCATSLVSPVLKDGQYCYAYTQEATKTEPYSSKEFIKMNILGGSVTGTKTGTQTGPGVSNGYEGTLSGILENDTIDVVFAYEIEGSRDMEAEIYKVRKDQTGIDKLRYPLKEGKDMLIPDMTKEFKTLAYAKVSCTP